MSDTPKVSKTAKIVIGVIILVLLISGAIYYFVTRKKAKANSISENYLTSSQFSANDKTMYQKMLQRFKEITGKTDGDIAWLLELMDKDIQAGKTNFPAGYFFEGGKPMLSGFLLGSLESGWYGFGYNDADPATSLAKDNAWNEEFSHMLQAYEGSNFATRYN